MAIKFFKRGLVLLAAASTLVFLAARYPASSHAQQDEKTIDQTHKNIVALKGLPDSQLGPIMNYFNAALGVQCNFCHVRENNQMAFDKDHEHKTIAREMIKMVQEVNKTSFEGRNTISCFTCHQGKAMPTAVPMLPLPAPAAPGMGPGGPGGPPGAPGAGAPPAAPPTADQIWDKYIQALGGKEAIAKVKSRSLKGTYTMANGMAFDFDVRYEAPDKIYSLLKSDRTGEMITAVSGSSGWGKDQRGQRDLNRGELVNALSLIETLETIKLSEPYPKMDVGRRKVKVLDRDAYMVRATRNNKRLTLYFDAETGLLLRKVETLTTFVGAIPEQTDFEDYRDVDGVKLPMTIRSASVEGSKTGVRKVTEVKNNPSIDSSIYKAPAK